MEFSFPVNFYYNNTGTIDMIICKFSTVRRVGAPNSEVGQRSTIIFFSKPQFPVMCKVYMLNAGKHL